MTAEWCLLVRCKGATMTSLVVYGSPEDMEARAAVAVAWGDAVEYLGPRGAQVVVPGLAQVQDFLTPRRRQVDS